MIDRKAKALVFVGVVLAHIAMLYWLNQIRGPIQAIDDQTVTELFFLPPLQKPAVRSTARSTVKQDDRVASPTKNQTEQEPTPITVPETDWYGSASQVITGKLNAPKVRDFSVKPRTTKSDQARTPEGVFKVRVHKRGDTEKIDGGELITWLSHECYATNIVAPSIPNEKGNPVTVCWGNMGKPPADGDLFLHLKPSYLQLPQTETERKILETQK